MALSGFSSLKTAEMFIDTIAETSPGWSVILIVAPDIPQTGEHGVILWVLCGHRI